jgi:hypothetical protein
LRGVARPYPRSPLNEGRLLYPAVPVKGKPRALVVNCQPAPLHLAHGLVSHQCLRPLQGQQPDHRMISGTNAMGALCRQRAFVQLTHSRGASVPGWAVLRAAGAASAEATPAGADGKPLGLFVDR